MRNVFIVSVVVFLVLLALSITFATVGTHDTIYELPDGQIATIHNLRAGDMEIAGEVIPGITVDDYRLTYNICGAGILVTRGIHGWLCYLW